MAPSTAHPGGLQLALDLGLPPAPGFDNFVAEDHAHEAIGRLRALAAGQRQDGLLHLWGQAGSGRSHLLAATRAAAPATTLLLSPASRPHDFAPQALLAPQDVPCAANGWLFGEAPAAAPRPAEAGGASLLLVDDVDALSGAQQAGLFRMLLAAQADPRIAVVTTGPAPASALALRDDLRSRLAAGLALRLQPLSDEAKHRALLAAAQARGLRMPPEVADHLLRHFPRDLSALMQILDALDRHSLERQRPLTVPLLREWAQRRLESEPT